MTHPARLSACFASGVPEAVAQRLLDDPRFAERARAMLVAEYGSFDVADLPEADRALISLGRPALEALARRAGIVIHAKGFVREIRGPAIAERATRFGEDALAGARAHVDLALDRAAITDMDALEQAIQTDGLGCLAAWVGTLPPPARKRLMLEWRDDSDLPRSDLGEHGANILRRLVAQP